MDEEDVPEWKVVNRATKFIAELLEEKWSVNLAMAIFGNAFTRVIMSYLSKEQAQDLLKNLTNYIMAEYERK